MSLKSESQLDKLTRELYENALKQIPPFGQRIVPGIPPGAENQPSPRVEVEVTAVTGDKVISDKRVRIKVPPQYLTGLTMGSDGDIGNLGGIVFPYTPIISFESKADYSESKPLHSNFSIYFYQRSSITPISINGKFTVENEYDAQNYLATQHLLHALTRMKFGLDSDAGAPPPVCRLYAYGNRFLNNVPVVISSYRVEYNDDVDYFESSLFETAVPTRSSIQITCIPMYSRNEMQNYSVNDYLTDDKYKNKGFV
jgi:hypothetical protein